MLRLTHERGIREMGSNPVLPTFFFSFYHHLRIDIDTRPAGRLWEPSRFRSVDIISLHSRVMRIMTLDYDSRPAELVKGGVSLYAGPQSSECSPTDTNSDCARKEKARHRG
jgi:hypothetical protein